LRGKILEGRKPQECYRGEIDPEGARRRKPVRGCETLKPERAEVWEPRGKRTPDATSAVGEATPWE
jgi:hypothetical protein